MLNYYHWSLDDPPEIESLVNYKEGIFVRHCLTTASNKMKGVPRTGPYPATACVKLKGIVGI